MTFQLNGVKESSAVLHLKFFFLIISNLRRVIRHSSLVIIK